MTETDGHRNELADLERGIPPSGLLVYYDRRARLPVGDPEGPEEARDRDSRILVDCELLHPTEAGDCVVRRGKLRVSEFLPDGREVTRAVLQTGSVLALRAAADELDIDGGHDLSRTALMALEESEIWTLPPGRLCG